MFITLRKLGPKARLIKDKSLEFKFGASFSTLDREWEKIKSYPSVESFFKDKKGKVFSSAENAQLFGKIEAISQTVTALAPILLEFGELVYLVLEKQKLARERGIRRQELRNRVESSGKEISQSLWESWIGRVKSLQSWLQYQENQLTVLKERLEATGRELQENHQKWSSLRTTILDRMVVAMGNDSSDSI